MMLGDMFVAAIPSPAFARALAVIADTLHSSFDKQPWIQFPGKSKESCVLATMATRDFLWRVGFKEAQCCSVYFAIKAVDRKGKELHSLGMGDHSKVPGMHRGLRPDKWSGHLVVRLPKMGWIVDTTLYPVIRPQWSDLPGMIAMPYKRDEEHRCWGMATLASLSTSGGQGMVMMAWLDQIYNDDWKTAPDHAKERRVEVIREMVQRFNGGRKER
jgi:hypothetical protein